MIIIADAGSSKTQWAACLNDGNPILIPAQEGCNPVTASDHVAVKRFSEAYSKIYDLASRGESLDKVYFYGAGCATPGICSRISALLREAFGCEVEVASDMLGAARALLGNEPGIACILGTGSNSALYDGSGLTLNTPPLGYILGDEGGGAAIGKRLLADIFKEIAPCEIRDKFFAAHSIDKSTLIEKVYRTPEANRWLASFSPFVKENISHPYIHDMVETLFSDFFLRNLSQYPDSGELPVNFTGSIAFHFEPQLREAGKKLGFNVAKVSKTPIEGMIYYHSHE